HALIQNPGELARLKANPDLMPTAVEEMIRWSTPVKEFMRTATADTVIRGVPIAAGESVYLSYASGNRDEEVFDEPFRFDVGRDPNKHLAFGYGVHFCLGAALARMEMTSLFTELIPRLESIELAGEPELSATTFVGGLKHLPIRYALRGRRRRGPSRSTSGNRRRRPLPPRDSRSRRACSAFRMPEVRSTARKPVPGRR